MTGNEVIVVYFRILLQDSPGKNTDSVKMTGTLVEMYLPNTNQAY
jgi:hypothetical protein